MSARRLDRSEVRLPHLGFAAFTIGIVYGPMLDEEQVRTLLQFLVVPGLSLTGGVLWALGPIRRWRRRRGLPAAPSGNEQAHG